MNEIFLNYEVELETKSNIRMVNFPHNREGFTQAMDLIESMRRDLIAAKITSTRDGEVYHYNGGEEQRIINY